MMHFPNVLTLDLDSFWHRLFSSQDGSEAWYRAATELTALDHRRFSPPLESPSERERNLRNALDTFNVPSPAADALVRAGIKTIPHLGLMDSRRLGSLRLPSAQLRLVQEAARALQKEDVPLEPIYSIKRYLMEHQEELGSDGESSSSSPTPSVDESPSSSDVPSRLRRSRSLTLLNPVVVRSGSRTVSSSSSSSSTASTTDSGKSSGGGGVLLKLSFNSPMTNLMPVQVQQVEQEQDLVPSPAAPLFNTPLLVSSRSKTFNPNWNFFSPLPRPFNQPPQCSTCLNPVSKRKIPPVAYQGDPAKYIGNPWHKYCLECFYAGQNNMNKPEEAGDFSRRPSLLPVVHVGSPSPPGLLRSTPTRRPHPAPSLKCKNAPHGCNTILTPAELSKHEGTACAFRQYYCPWLHHCRFYGPLYPYECHMSGHEVVRATRVEEQRPSVNSLASKEAWILSEFDAHSMFPSFQYRMFNHFLWEPVQFQFDGHTFYQMMDRRWFEPLLGKKGFFKYYFWLWAHPRLVDCSPYFFQILFYSAPGRQQMTTPRPSLSKPGPPGFPPVSSSVGVSARGVVFPLTVSSDEACRMKEVAMLGQKDIRENVLANGFFTYKLKIFRR